MGYIKSSEIDKIDELVKSGKSLRDAIFDSGVHVIGKLCWDAGEKGVFFATDYEGFDSNKFPMVSKCVADVVDGYLEMNGRSIPFENIYHVEEDFSDDEGDEDGVEIIDMENEPVIHGWAWKSPDEFKKWADESYQRLKLEWERK